MVAGVEAAESVLNAAIAAIGGPSENLSEALDALPLAVYVADAEGRVTHYNRACISFAGRQPRPGADRWCVTWRLYTTEGEPLAHESCPMAVAVKERRAVRGLEAFAERPDGSRIRFLPLPTPLFREDGEFAGAVNVMVDVTDLRRAVELREQAARCRRLSSSVLDRRTLDALKSMAAEYEEEAERLSPAN